MIAGTGVRGIWTGLLGILVAFSYFYARASKKTCWLKIPSYPWLGIDLVLYFLGQHFVSDTAIRVAPVLAALYYLLCNFHINLEEVDSFLKTHASLERLPVRRLAKINQGMMWLVSAVTAAAMIAAPYLGIDQLIRKGGQALKTVIRWLLHLIPNSTTEEGTMAAEQMNQMMPATASKEIPWFLELLYKLLDLIGWMIGIGLALACIFVVLRALYRLYLHFNEKTEENGDKIERLLPPPAAEKKKNLNRKKKEHLFWNRSADGRIRKHYRKKVLEKLKGSPDSAWTPTQTAGRMELEDADAKVFAQIYEKARYAETSCTKEEMEKMLRIR